MSDLCSSNCGCERDNNYGCGGCGCTNMCGYNNNNGGNGISSCLWIVILLLCCGNGFGNNRNDCGCGGNGGCDSCIWIILLLIFCGGNNFGGCC